MRWHMQSRAAARAGVTLVELLVVVAIIGLVVALLLPAVQMARETARRAECQSNLRQLGVAMALHANAHGEFPVGCIGYRSVSPPALPLSIAWNVQILPFLEEDSIAAEFDFSLPSCNAANKPVAATIISVFLCPSTREDPQRNSNGLALRNPTGLWKGCAFTDYSGIYGVEGPNRGRDPAADASLQTLRDDSLGVLLYEEPVAPRQVTDGLSKTACIAETVDRREAETEWVNGQNLFAQQEATPINVDVDPGNEIGSPHPGGASLVFGDAHVAFVAESIDQSVLNAMLTKAGGESP